MKKAYTEKEMKRILKKELVVPEQVNSAMKQAYQTVEVPEHVTMQRYRKHRKVVVLAAVMVVLAAATVVGFAANGYFNKTVKQEGDRLGYQFAVNYDLTPNEVTVLPGYLPEGFKLMEDGPYGGKIHNEETGEGFSVLAYNAVTMDEAINGEMFSFQNVVDVQKMTLHDMEAHLVTTEDKMYGMHRSILLFNEVDGYVVQIWAETSVSDEELKKVADTVKIDVSEGTAGYRAQSEKDAEQAQWKAQEAKMEAAHQAGVEKKDIFAIGEEVHNPWVDTLSDVPDPYGETLDSHGDVRFTVEDAQIVDALPLSDYPKENYSDYEGQIAPGVNADGTLKPFERATYQSIMDEDPSFDTTNSKYLVVKMKARNMRDTASDMYNMGTVMTPGLQYLIPGEDGNYQFSNIGTRPVEVELSSLHGLDGDFGYGAFYFDKPYHTEGIERLKDFHFRVLEPMEELEYTIAYAVDTDRLENIYLQFYQGHRDADDNQIPCYVKVK